MTRALIACGSGNLWGSERASWTLSRERQTDKLQFVILPKARGLLIPKRPNAQSAIEPHRYVV